MEKSQGSFPRKAACHSTTEPRARALAVSQLQLLIQKHLLITCCVCQAQEWGLWRGIQTKLDMELPPSRRWEERREKCRERETYFIQTLRYVGYIVFPEMEALPLINTGCSEGISLSPGQRGRQKGGKRRVAGRKAFSRRSENLHGGSVNCSSSVGELRAGVSDENLRCAGKPLGDMLTVWSRRQSPAIGGLCGFSDGDFSFAFIALWFGHTDRC